MRNNAKVEVLLAFLCLNLGIGGAVLAYDITKDKCTYEVAVGHLDTQWEWTRTTTYNELIPKTLHDNFSLFAKYPRYVFSFAGAFRYWIAEQANQNPFGNFQAGDWDTLKGYIASGRWALAGSCVDEIDVNLPCAETLCRNFLYGNGYYQDRFGKTSIDMYLPDCFGFAYDLPTIACHFGVRGFSTQKFDNPDCGWWAPVPDNLSIMKWMGPDGSYVFAAMKPSSYISSYEVNANLGNALQNQCGLWTTYDYYGIGDQGGAPYEDTVRQLCNLPNGQLDGAYCFPAASDSLFRDLVRLEQAGNPSIGRMFNFDGELIHWRHGTGTYTVHGDIKKLFRNCEIGGLTAEPAAVMANKLTNGTYAYPQATLWKAWFTTIDHAFHDDLTGTSIPEAYTNISDGTIPSLDSQMVNFAAVKTAANAEVNKILNTTVSVSAVPVVVYNPLALDRRDVIQASVSLPSSSSYVKVVGPDGVETPSQVIAGAPGSNLTILFVADVPSVGYKVYEVSAAATACAIQTGLSIDANGGSMSNNEYNVTFDNDGDILQVTDKKSNKNLFAKACKWEIRPDNSKNWPQWEVLKADVLSNPVGNVDGSPIKTVVESGPVRVSLKVTRNKEGNNYTHTYSLCADSAGRIIVVDNTVQWNNRGRMIKAAFFCSVSADSAIYSTGIGTIKRPVSGTDNRYEVPAQNWAVEGDGNSGVAVLTTYKYGWSRPAKGTLDLTLIHSPGPDDYYAQGDIFTHTFSYAIYGFSGDWRNGVDAQAQRFNEPLTAMQTTAHAATGPIGKTFSLVRVSNPAKAMIMGLKKPEKSTSADEVIVRLREIPGTAAGAVNLVFGASITAAVETNGMEAKIADVTFNGNTLSFSIGKYQIKTFKVTLGGFTSVRGSFNGSNPSFDDMAFKVVSSAGGKLSMAKFLLGRDDKVQKVYLTNVKGQVVRTLHNGPMPLEASAHIVWDGKNNSGNLAPAGVYVVNVVTDHAQKHAPMRFVK
jgi:alpha-mannosidase